MALSMALNIVKDLVETQSAHNAVSLILTKKKLSDDDRKGIRTLYEDFLFKIRRSAKNDTLNDQIREKIWAALDFMRSAPTMKFMKPEVERSMSGFRPGVLEISEPEENNVDDLINGPASVGGDDAQIVSDDEGGEPEQHVPFRDIQGGASSSEQAGEYMECGDGVDDAAGDDAHLPKEKSTSQQKRKAAPSRQLPSKKNRESSPNSGAPSTPGKSKLWSARVRKYPICLELSESKSIFMGKHPDLVDEAARRNAAMSAGKTPLNITDNTVAIVSKWESKTGSKAGSGAILTLLTHDELCE